VLKIKGLDDKIFFQKIQLEQIRRQGKKPVLKIKGLDDKIFFQKIQLEQIIIFSIKKIAIYSIFLQASIKDFQATGKAFSPLQRTSRTSKYEIY
jgi:hypothetical protein